MKKIFSLFAAVAIAAGTASAQDINTATEAYNNGAVSLQMGDNAAAIENFQSALSMAEGLGDEAAQLVENCKNGICSANMSIAKALYNSKKFAEALDAFNKTKALADEYGNAEVAAEAEELIAPTQKNLYNTAGTAAKRAKDYPTAIENFKKVLELDPANGPAAAQLGDCYYRTKQLDLAVEVLNVAIENGQEEAANKTLSNVYVLYAQAARKAKNTQDAYDKAMKSNEYLENANAYRLAAGAAQELGKNDECIALYEKYLELKPNAKDAAGVKFTIAALYQQGGNKEKAKEYYQMVVADPKFGADAAAQLKTL